MSNKKPARGVCYAFLISLLLLLPLLEPWILDALCLILFGWFHHLTQVLPNLHINWELLLSFIISIILGLILLHKFIAWLHIKGALQHKWKPLQTIMISTLVMLLFGIAISMTGLVHQSIWMMKEDLLTNKQKYISSQKSISQIRNIYTALLAYSSKNEGNFPQRLTQLLEAGFIDSEDMFYIKSLSPHSSDVIKEPLVYYYPLDTSSPPSSILLHSSSSTQNGLWIVAKLDGSVSYYDGKSFHKELNQTLTFIHKSQTLLEMKSQ